MNAVTNTELRNLVSIVGGRCVSMYMPTEPAGRDDRQDVIRLTNLVAAAEQNLVQSGMRGMDANEFLKSIAELPIQASWAHRAQGLAIFRSETAMVNYHVDVRFRESLFMGRHFHVRPLLPAIGSDPEYFILACSRNQVRLLKCTLRGFERLEPPGLPTSMERGLNLQGADRGQQVHSGMRGDIGKEAGVFHGQGGHRDTLKDELVEYVRLIENAVLPVLRQTNSPLILAGVDYELAILRKAFDYRHFAEQELHGAFDHLDDCTLYVQSLPIARTFDEPRRTCLHKYADVADTVLASDDTEEILTAAHEGRIDCLIVDSRADVFGRFDRERNEVKLVSRSDPDLDLIELAIMQTVLHNGAVCSVDGNELPNSAPLRAVFRY